MTDRSNKKLTGKNNPRDLYAYIDETGDRGAGSKSSPIFGMAAVLVDDQGETNLREAIEQLRQEFGVPTGKLMSWKDTVKTHDRRRRAAEVLGAVRGLTVLYIYCVKAELHPGSYVGNPQRLYDFVACRMYKAILWAARNRCGPSARVWTRFGHVRSHDHNVTADYINQKCAQDDKVPTHLEQGLRWVGSAEYAESQAADLFAGFLKSAIWPDGEFNYIEPMYLNSVWHLIRKNDQGCAIPLGIMSMPEHGLLADADWFPCGHACPRKKRAA